MRLDRCIEYGWSCEEDLPTETLARPAKSEHPSISGSESQSRTVHRREELGAKNKTAGLTGSSGRRL